MSKKCPLTGGVIGCVLLTLFFMGLSGCTASSTHHPAHSVSDQGAVVSPKNLNPVLADMGGAVSARVEDGKTIVSFPLDRATEATPFYEEGILTLVFAPSTFALFVPREPVGVLARAIPRYYDGGLQKMTSLEFILTQPAQFLLSRPTPDRLQVQLVPKVSTQQQPEGSTTEPSIEGVRFSRNKQGNLFITLTVGSQVTFQPRDEQAGKMSFFLADAEVPARFSKLYRLEKFSTSITSALLRNVPGGALLTLLSPERIPVQTDRQDGKLVLQFMTQEIDRSLLPPLRDEFLDGAKAHTDGNANEVADEANTVEMNALFPGMKKKYSGRKISLDFQDADVELVLRLIAEDGNYNLIIDDAVTGKISLKLEDIPYEQALDLVLLQKGLGMVKQGNIMRITTAKKLEAEQAQLNRARAAALKTRESLTNLEPLQTRYIQINYSTAAEMEPKVREFLSARGKISQDARTNMLIIRDAGSQLLKIQAVVDKLDRPERQVLIEARIVYATDSFQRSIGINWSGTYNHNDVSSQYSESFNVSGVALPASVGGMNAGVNIAKIAGLDLFTLDAQLRLGELKNISKTISSPRVVTLNNNRAEIQQGTKVANQGESESGGTTTEYTDAILSLSVQPQITPNNKLILDLDISDDAPSGDDISTRSTKTKMIVSDNETIVIGGVQKSTETNTEDRIPGLANIPGLGWLFKNESTLKQKEELLIFIRPKILD